MVNHPPPRAGIEEVFRNVPCGYPFAGSDFRPGGPGRPVCIQSQKKRLPLHWLRRRKGLLPLLLHSTKQKINPRPQSPEAEPPGIFCAEPFSLLLHTMGIGRWEGHLPRPFSSQEVFPMADIKQDLLSLQYSTSFSLSGMEEANIDLQLSAAPLPHPL